MSVSNIDERIHPVVEGSFCYDIHDCVANLSQDHKNMRFEAPENPNTHTCI